MSLMGSALAYYDEVLKYAPNWKQLKEARDTAAKEKIVFALPQTCRSRPSAAGRDPSMDYGRRSCPHRAAVGHYLPVAEL
jgi:hypothetical protein